MSDEAIMIICVTAVQIIMILAFFTDFFNNLFKKKP